MTWLKTALAALIAAAAAAGSALAQAPDAKGVWIDHTGRGAVEITDCEGRLCGRVVWLKNAAHGSECGKQVIGNVRPMANGRWDGGWIYDPDQNSKFSVELTPVGADKLRVVGYMGSKLFSETMMWKRAPADIKRCTA